MASFVYNAGSDGLLTGGSINWASDTIKARLVSSGATPPTRDDTSMTGHTAIGTDQTLGSKTKTKDTTTDRIVFDAADPTWTAVASGATVRSIDIFKFVTNDAGSTPIANLVLPADTPTSGADIVINFDPAGMFYLQQ